MVEWPNRAGIGTGIVDVVRDELRLGARVRLSANDTGNNFTTATAFNGWDTEEYDDLGIWASGSASRLTVPGGVTKVILSASIAIANATANTEAQIYLHKNGSTFNGSPGEAGLAGDAFWNILNIMSGPLSVDTDDYFEVIIQQETDTSVDVQALLSHFAMWVFK